MRLSNDLYAEKKSLNSRPSSRPRAGNFSFFEELRKLGVEYKGPDGLCDFYSMMDGREVFCAGASMSPKSLSGTTWMPVMPDRSPCTPVANSKRLPNREPASSSGHSHAAGRYNRRTGRRREKHGGAEVGGPAGLAVPRYRRDVQGGHPGRSPLCALTSRVMRRFPAWSSDSK